MRRKWSQIRREKGAPDYTLPRLRWQPSVRNELAIRYWWLRKKLCRASGHRLFDRCSPEYDDQGRASMLRLEMARRWPHRP